MNEIIVPDLTGSDSEKINELYRYIEELRMETSSEISSLCRRIESITNVLRGGDTS